MKTQINPYLTFDGNCSQAMTFYHQCLGGDLTIQTAADSPMASQTPDNLKNQVIHASLISDGITLFASDFMGMAKPNPGNTITLALNTTTEDETNRLFTALSADGQVRRPLNKEFWGGIYGEFTDKYGMPWLINYQPDRAA